MLRYKNVIEACGDILHLIMCQAYACSYVECPQRINNSNNLLKIIYSTSSAHTFMTLRSQMEAKLSASCLIESYYFKEEPRGEQNATFIHVTKN